MFVKNLLKGKKRVLEILKKEPEGRTFLLKEVVESVYAKKNKILNLVHKYGTPFYLLDPQGLQNSAEEFQRAFSNKLSGRSYYAVKSNYHPVILKTVVKKGFGLDVSSGRELKLALKAGSKHIVFSGPGKTNEELGLALKYSKIVTVHLDNFNELKRLGVLAALAKKKIRAGVRIFTPYHLGNKFGIPLEDLKLFWQTSRKYPYVELRGIQSHLSWNKESDKYSKVIELLGTYLKKQFSRIHLNEVEFIDLGGGFFPDKVEGYYPWTSRHPVPLHGGALIKMANAALGEKTEFRAPYYITESKTPEEFAQIISRAVSKHLRFLPNCQFYVEPGRIICTPAMHIVVSVVDIKRFNVGIADGGLNATGWEFGEHFYYPLVDLTHPSKKEIEFTLYGPLCTPRDVWGYTCFAKKVDNNDVIVIPNQGAYRYTLAQEFIKSIPPVYSL